MRNLISRFAVNGLYGRRNIDLQLSDNTLVLVGENGAGKTTVLRLLYYVLSKQWSLLARYQFESIIVTLGKKRISILHSLVDSAGVRYDRSLVEAMPASVRRRMEPLFARITGIESYDELEHLCELYDIPLEFARYLWPRGAKPGAHRKELDEIGSQIATALDCQVLYLPTYRRIEQELELVLREIEWEERTRRKRNLSLQAGRDTYVELVEFGMRDVEEAITAKLASLKEFARESLNNLTLGYLGDVVDRQYDSVSVSDIQQTSEETIHNVLNRIDEKILSRTQRDSLFATVALVRRGGEQTEHAKVICHYFLKLLQFQEDLQKRESQITAFCAVCNEYLTDKRLQYDSSDFRFSIAFREQAANVKGIELRDLSSGEKQIVSLFSHLYLSGSTRYFVLIDEPELSLSVPWQRRFLTDIRDGAFCAGLVAATHSPFVYENALRPYAHSLDEFTVDEAVR
jgi:ABC-type transport system involved in cytochrome c biogenesis ATPase subunit